MKKAVEFIAQVKVRFFMLNSLPFIRIKPQLISMNRSYLL
jgi:hypothetical protein